MPNFIIALVLIALAIVALTLRKTYYYLPEPELKRQARHGDRLAKTLHSAVAYGANLRLLLWLAIGVFAALGFMLLARVAPPIFGFVAIALLLWFSFAWMPSTRLTSVGARLAMWCTPVVVWLLHYLHRPFDAITTLWHRYFPLQTHSGLYEQEDLQKLLDQQKRQPDNRIPVEVIELAERALNFDRHKVGEVTTLSKTVKAVSQDDAVGPILLDELHATGHSRFPVYDRSEDNIIGTIHLISLEEAKQSGHVRDFMQKGVAYLHENDTLADALHAVYHTKHQLFVVVNSFEEYVGIITLEDVLHALIGQPLGDDFDAHASKTAVAGRHSDKKEPDLTEAVEPTEEKIPEASQEVIV